LTIKWLARRDSRPPEERGHDPSVPFEELSDPPRFEVRYAELPDTNGVVIFYRRYFDGEIVDRIDVTVLQ
jgi:hypothetical protein